MSVTLMAGGLISEICPLRLSTQVKVESSQSKILVMPMASVNRRLNKIKKEKAIINQMILISVEFLLSLLFRLFKKEMVELSISTKILKLT